MLIWVVQQLWQVRTCDGEWGHGSHGPVHTQTDVSCCIMILMHTAEYAVLPFIISITASMVHHCQEERICSCVMLACSNSLKLANEHELKTVAFPAISTGVYGYPIPEAADVRFLQVIAYLVTALNVHGGCSWNHALSYCMHVLGWA